MGYVAKSQAQPPAQPPVQDDGDEIERELMRVEGAPLPQNDAEMPDLPPPTPDEFDPSPAR